jgi:hypothetical protein
MANLGDLYKDLNGQESVSMDELGAMFGVIADYAGAVNFIAQVIGFFLPKDNQLADVLNAIQSDFTQIAQMLGAEDKLERMRDIDAGINPAIGVLQQLPDIAQNLQSLPPSFILQQIQTCIDSALFFDFDDKWQAVVGSVPVYSDGWSGTLTPPSSGGLVFNYTYTLPQFLRAIYILITTIQALQPSSLSSYQSTFARCAARLQTVHDTIVSTGIVGTRLPTVEDVGWVDSGDPNESTIPEWISQWGSPLSGGSWPYGAVEIYSAADNVGNYFPFINSPIDLTESDPAQAANFLTLLQFRIELQKKALYMHIGLPVIRRTLNYLSALSGQAAIAQTPYEDCALTEAFSLLGLGNPTPGTAALLGLRAFLANTPPYSSWWAFDPTDDSSGVPDETQIPGWQIPAPGKIGYTFLGSIRGPGWPYPNPPLIMGLIG